MKCNSLEEVRNNIDRIDNEIIKLIAERGVYVSQLKEGYPYAYVWNREEEFGEIGCIQIKMEQGGLVRVA